MDWSKDGFWQKALGEAPSPLWDGQVASVDRAYDLGRFVVNLGMAVRDLTSEWSGEGELDTYLLENLPEGDFDRLGFEVRGEEIRIGSFVPDGAKLEVMPVISVPSLASGDSKLRFAYHPSVGADEREVLADAYARGYLEELTGREIAFDARALGRWRELSGSEMIAVARERGCLDAPDREIADAPEDDGPEASEEAEYL